MRYVKTFKRAALQARLFKLMRPARSLQLDESIIPLVKCSDTFMLEEDRGSLKKLGLAAVDDKGRKLFRKEVIYPGHFVKMKPDSDEPEVEFEVTQRMIKNWVKQHRRLLDAGIEVPLPLQHSTDPESRRGTVLRLSKEFNADRGVDSLYMYVRFRDKAAEKLASTTQVSLFSPPEFVDGTGQKYERPIRHVALTDYPVISGLDDFKVIAASFGGETHIHSSEDTNMTTLQKVSTRLGIKSPESADALTLSNGLIRRFNRQGKALQLANDKIDELKKSLEDDDSDSDSTGKGLSLEISEEQLTQLITQLISKAMNEKADAEFEEDEDEDAEFEEDADEDEDAEFEEDEDDDEDDIEAGDDEDDIEAGDDDEDDDVELGDDEDCALADDEDEDDTELSFSFKAPVKKKSRGRKRTTTKGRRKVAQTLQLSNEVIGLLREGRDAKLENLVNTGKISPHRARRLRKQFCTKNALKLSLDDNNSQADPFDAVVLSLQENKGRKFGARTGSQTQRGERNAVLADAQRRADEANPKA